MHIRNRKSLASCGWITKPSSQPVRIATQKSGKSKPSKLDIFATTSLLLIYFTLNGLVLYLWFAALTVKFENSFLPS